MQYIFNFATTKFARMTTDSLAHDLEKILESKKKIAILSHFNPDGDAIGSSMGMYHYLRSRGKEARVVIPSAKPAFLDFLDPEQTIICHTDNRRLAEETISGSDLLICLDFNTASRTEGLAGALRSSAACKVMIDHHPCPDTEGFSIVISDPASSSTCELLYRTLMSFRYTEGRPERIGIESLTAITTGILTDTNNFSNSITPYTFTAASELLKAGVDFDHISNIVFKHYSESRMRLMGHLLKDSMEIDYGTGASCIVLTLEDKEKYSIQDGDTEGFVNLPLMVRDVEISALFSETKDFIRVSLRSKGKISVNAMSREFFNGGGHERAAGGRLYIPAAQVREYFRNALEQFLQKTGQK